MRRRAVTATYLATGAVALLAAPAAASPGGDRVIKDCTDDGRIQGSYEREDYRDALRDLPSDVDEYTDCREVIRAAQTSGGKLRKKVYDAGFGGTPVSAEEGRALAKARDRARQRSERGEPITVGGTAVVPGESGGALGSPAGGDDGGNDIPGAVVALLVALALASLGAAAYLNRDSVRRLAGAVRGLLRR